MKVVRNIADRMATAHRQAQAGNLDDAAAAYQEVVDTDPANRVAVDRLVIVYRRLKAYGKELAVIDAALQAMKDSEKAARDAWMAAHPAAAKLGQQVWRSMGGDHVTAYGTNPLLSKLLRRKAVLEKKLGKKSTEKGAGKIDVKNRSRDKIVPSAADKQAKKKAEQQKAAADKKEKQANERKAAAEKRKAEAAERKSKRGRIAEQQRAAKLESKARPSLFVVSLHYLVSLDRIDAAMDSHVAFLDRHFTTGDFLVAGRQVPRTGGIILARGKSKDVVQRMMMQDPFIKRRLASMEIVEFRTSRMGKGLAALLSDPSHPHDIPRKQ